MSQAERPMYLYGTAGEHIAVADMILLGHKAFLTSAGFPYDVILDVGQALRVAVKATMAARPRSGRTLTRPCYQFNITRAKKLRYTAAEADIVALVALDIRKVAYLPCVKCPTILHIDAPGPRVYPNAKGPRRGQGRHFEDFPLSKALKEM